MTGAIESNTICFPNRKKNDDEVDAIIIRKYDKK